MTHQKYFAKKQVKKHASRCLNALAATLLISVILSHLFYFAYAKLLPIITRWVADLYIISGIGGKSQGIIFSSNLFSSAIFSYFISMLETLICLVFPMALVATKILRLSFDECFNTKGKTEKAVVPILSIALLMSIAASQLAGFLSSLLLPDSLIYEVPDYHIQGGNDIFSLFAEFLLLCVFTAIVEEFVFRGVIYTALRKFGKTFAIVSSALVFALMHASISQLAYCTVFGIVLAYVYEKTGNLKTSILLHFLNNTIIFITSTLIPALTESGVLADKTSSLINFIFGVTACIGVMFFIKNQKNNISLLSFNEDGYAIPIIRFVTPATLLLMLLFIYNLL